jgi:aspartate/glutamate racemase
MHVGLIVGIGPAATDLYYRFLITTLAARGVDLELTMAHADTPTLTFTGRRRSRRRVMERRRGVGPWP